MRTITGKILAVCLILALLAGICGCSGKDDDFKIEINVPESSQTGTDGDTAGTDVSQTDEGKKAPVISVPEQKKEEKPEDTENKPDEEKHPSVQTFAERISGKYLYAPAGRDEQTTMEITCFDGTVWIEVREQMGNSYEDWYTAWIVQAEPEDNSVLKSTDADSGIFQLREYSGFSFLGQYWDAQKPAELILTENGLTFRPVNGSQPFLTEDTEVSVVRNDRAPSYRDTDEMRNMLETYGNAGDGESVVGLAGEWHGVKNRVYYRFRFSEDGTVFMVIRAMNEPPAVYSGVYTTCGDELCMYVTQLGWPMMPEITTLYLAMSDEGLGFFRQEEYTTPAIVTSDEALWLVSEKNLQRELSRMGELTGNWVSYESGAVLRFQNDGTVYFHGVDPFGGDIEDPALQAEYRDWRFDENDLMDWHAELTGSRYSMRYYLQEADNEILLHEFVYYYGDEGEESSYICDVFHRDN